MELASTLYWSPNGRQRTTASARKNFQIKHAAILDILLSQKEFSQQKKNKMKMQKKQVALFFHSIPQKNKKQQPSVSSYGFVTLMPTPPLASITLNCPN